MKKDPVNNGKDIPEIETHTIHGFGGQKNNVLKTKIRGFDPVPYEPKGKIIEADFGSLSYEKDELTKIKLVVEPIKVILDY